jgi:hypothetical protein
VAQVRLELPDAVYERARREAESAREPVETYLARYLEERVLPVWEDVDLTGLSDEQLLLHIRASVAPEVQERLDGFRTVNSERRLTADEQSEYERLIRVGHAGTMLKARALLAWKSRHGHLPPGFEAFEKPA